METKKCGKCNKLAGFAKDDVVLLERMIKYLEQYQVRPINIINNV